MTNLPMPHQRETAFGRDDVERRLREALSEGVLSNGWMITGGEGAGKATLAYRLARAVLDPAALADDQTLQVVTDEQVFRLVAGSAHPDLFIAERRFDEKKGRYETEISVETIRRLTSFLNKTPSFGGWRVAIVDAADDLNRNAANALLKSLEEPPRNTLVLLVANAPGRLLATIRSRCRRIDLKPLEDSVISTLLSEELGLSGEEAASVAAAAHGRPGYALTLAAGEGAEAVSAAGGFLKTAISGGDAARIGQALAGRQAGSKWEIFKTILLEALSDAARSAARGEATSGALKDLPADVLVEGYEQIADLFGRGDALNLDRAQLLAAAARALKSLARRRAA